MSFRSSSTKMYMKYSDSAPLLRSGETPYESCVQLWSRQHSTDLDRKGPGPGCPEKLWLLPP